MCGCGGLKVTTPTEPGPTADELLEEEARRTAHLPPERIPSAEGLPEDVRDGRIADDAPEDPAAPVVPKEV